MATNYENFDSPYDNFMNRGTEQGASGTSNSLNSLNTAGSTTTPSNSTGGSETATTIESSQVATTENTTGNGNVETMPTKDSGGINDLWINTFIKSTNWKPKKQGFWIDGATGYAEFVNVYVSGNINASTGTIGGFVIGPDYIRDSVNSFGLSSTVTGADDVRFWAGSTFASRATAPFRIHESGSLVATSFLLQDSSNNTILQASSGTSGTYILNMSTTSSVSNGIFISSTQAGVGLYLQNNSNTNNRSLIIEQTSTGASNGNTVMSISHGGSGTGLAISNLNPSTATSLLIDRANTTGTGYLLQVIDSSSINSGSTQVYFSKTGNTSGTLVSLLDNSSTQASIALFIESNTSSASGPALYLDKKNSGYAQYIKMTASNGNNTIGMGFEIANGGLGKEYAFEFRGDEYDGGKTAVSGFAGVIKIITLNDGACFIPYYDTAT